MKLFSNFLAQTGGTWEGVETSNGSKPAVSYISRAIRSLAKQSLDGPLSSDMILHSVEEIMQGKATPAQISAFLVSLSIHGVSSEVIHGMAQVLLSHAKPSEIPESFLKSNQVILDIQYLFNKN